MAPSGSAVGGGDRVGDQGDVVLVEVAEVLAEPDGDAGAGEAGGDPQDGLLGAGAGQLAGLQGVDGGVPADHGQRLAGGDGGPGGDEAAERGLVQEVAVPVDQHDGRDVGAQPVGGVIQQAGQLAGGQGLGVHRRPSWSPPWSPPWSPAGAGSSSGGALGWACRPMTWGTAMPTLWPAQYTVTWVRSNGSKTSSTLRPVRNGSTQYTLPSRATVAVLRTSRITLQQNASRSSAGSGRAGGPAA